MYIYIYMHINIHTGRESTAPERGPDAGSSGISVLM